jgi:circadian clock protein KaiC
MTPSETAPPVRQLTKAPTGIPGLDDVLLGGLPAGRPTLICGAAGCGKTLLGMTFLVNGEDRSPPDQPQTTRPAGDSARMA